MKKHFSPSLPLLLAILLALSVCGQPLQPKQSESVLSEERRAAAVELISIADAETLANLYEEQLMWESMHPNTSYAQHDQHMVELLEKNASAIAVQGSADAFSTYIQKWVKLGVRQAALCASSPKA